MYDQELDNRPGSDVDDLEKSFDKSAGSDDVARGIREAELHANTDSGNKSASSDSENNIPFKNDDDAPKKGLKRITGAFGSRRAKIMGSIAALSATAAIAGTVISSPVFIMNHISDLILQKTGEQQTRQSVKFRRSRFAHFSDRFSVDGRRGGAVIKEMKAFGYKFDFDTTDKNKITRIQRGGELIDPADFEDEISGFIDNRYSILAKSDRVTGWKTKRMKAFRTRYKIPESSIVTARTTDVDDPKTEMNKRQVSVMNGEEDAGPRIRLDADEPNEDDFANKADYDRAKAEYDGINGIDSDSPFEKGRKQLADGVDADEIDPIARGAANLDTGEVSKEVADAAVDSAKGSVASSGFAIAKGVAVISDPLDKACTAHNALETAIKTARVVNSVKLMRASMAFVTADDGQRKGEASAALVRELLKRVTLSDPVLGNFANAQGYKKVTSGRFSKSRNDDTGTKTSVKGKLSGFWGGIHKSTGKVPGCPVIQNVFFQAGQVVAIIGISIFTFGTGTAAAGGGAEALKLGVTTTFKSLITRQALKGIALGFVIDFSFDQILSLVSIYVQKTLDIPFTGQEVGGSYASILFGGAGVAHKQKNLRSGFLPATKRRFSQSRNTYLAELKAEKREKSFAQRIFDMDDSDSLAYKGFTQVAFQGIDPAQSVHNDAVNIASLPSMFATAVSSPITLLSGGSAYAQDDDELAFETIEINGVEYATDTSGNLETDMPDWVSAYAEDPAAEVENVDFLITNGHIDPVTEEPLSPEFKGLMENCYETTDQLSIMEDTSQDYEEDISRDCMATQDLTKRFIKHLAALDADDVFDGAVFTEDLDDPSTNQQASGASSTTLTAPGLNGYAIPCQGIKTPVIRVNDGDAPHADWSSRQSSGVLSDTNGNPINGSDGNPINVYIREACPGAANVKTIFIASSIHGSENGGQLVSHELLYNEDLDDNIRIVAVPEINKYGITFRDQNGYGGRINGDGVNLNRNFDYNWGGLPSGSGGGNYKGPSPGSSPEAQALTGFVRALPIDLAIHYHDNIHYVAAVGNSTPLELARIYGRFSPTSPLRPREGGRVFQSGSFDGWQNNTLRTPALLVEMAQNQSTDVISQHVEAVKEVISSGLY